MAIPNIDTVTASLERAFRNCSLNHNQESSGSSDGGGGSDSAVNPSPEPSAAVASITVELNSQSPLPTNWEQYLDLKTGEIYYINRKTGMRTTEDPRSTAAASGGGYYSEDEWSSYYSDGSSSEGSSPSRGEWSDNKLDCPQENLENEKKRTVAV